MISLPADSGCYDVITRAVEKCKDIPGLTCEIGLRCGGGTKVIVDALVASGSDKIHIAIDPYGNIEYAHKDDCIARCDYTNAMRDEYVPNVYSYCKEQGVNFYFFNMEDTEFFKRYADGIPVYNQFKSIHNLYSFVHFDGPHTVTDVIAEIDFFHPRTPLGATFVFDDIAYYNHNEVDSYLENLGWWIYETSDCKYSYVKRG
jgi:hypothetical protein